jgi:ribosomal protein S18 acetylase RimI-like enzyme
MSMQFRIATAADAPVIVALIEAAYRGPETAGQWDSESHLLKGPRTNLAEIGALIARPDSRFIVAEDGGRIIGCALIQQTDVAAASPETAAADNPRRRPGRSEATAEPVTRGAYFGMFAIDPAIRAAGLGKLVLAEAEARAQYIFNATCMVMTVINVREQLIAWYQRRGYRLTGKRIPFPFTETSGETTRDFDLAEMRKDF